MEHTNTHIENLLEENMKLAVPSAIELLGDGYQDEVLDEMELSEEEALYPCEEDLIYPEVLSLELDYMDEVLQEDKLWKARTGLNEESICGAIETIVFMSDKPVPLLRIKSLIDEDMPLRVVHDAIARLQAEYEEKHHGIRLQEVAQGYQFRTKATYSKYVQDLFKINELVLSPTALEVLAIISYKQPVSKVEVEKIRGVDSSHIVRGLMDKRLVKVVGRSDEAGRPVLYGTTNEFLEVFNLSNIEQLPPEHELQEIVAQGAGKITDIKHLVNADLKERFSQDEMDELEQLSNSIKTIDIETPFTKSLKVEERKRTKKSGEEVVEVKTAFDLLEEYLDISLVADANKQSIISEIFTAINAPQVISDLSSGPFNEPEDMEDEEFEMIDLDTGEVIRDESEQEVILELEGEQDVEVSVELINDSEVQEGPEEKEVVILGDGRDEAAELAAALDSAFAKLIGNGDTLDEAPLSSDEIEDNIDEKTDNLIEEAKDLDLDLSFMKNNDLADSEDHLN